MNIVHVNRLNSKLNSTLYTWNDESSYSSSNSDDSLLADGSGSGDGEDDDIYDSSGDAPPETSSPPTTTPDSDINFIDQFTSAKPPIIVDPKGSASSLLSSNVLILLTIVLHCLRHSV